MLVWAILAFSQTEDNWTYLHETTEVEVYLDFSTVRQSGPNIRTAWMRDVNKTNKIVNHIRSVYELKKMRFDCMNEESGLMSWTGYDANGQSILILDYKGEDITMNSLAPGTNGLASLRAVCDAEISRRG